MFDIEKLKFDEKGLIPAIVVDDKTGDVLTLAYMNEEAFDQMLSNYKTLAEKKVSTYVLLEIDPCGRTYEEMDKLLRGKIRANDVIGVGEDGKLEILMAQATEKDLQFILPRFQNFRIEVK